MSDSKTINIIIADDDEDDRELFAEAIEESNANVRAVPNGVELMRFLENTNTLPDFVFLDLNMPEKNGKECLQEIRANQKFSSIPVVIYSTSSNKRDVEETFELGANLYITKPTSFSELRKTVKGILDMDFPFPSKGTSRNSFVFNASS